LEKQKHNREDTKEMPKGKKRKHENRKEKEEKS
jgi:hypothetical protein